MLFGLVCVAWLVISLIANSWCELVERHRFIHFGECNPFLIAEFLKVDSKDPWVPLEIQKYSLQACNRTVYTWNQMDPSVHNWN